MLKCKNCSKELELSSGKRFCSRECYSEYRLRALNNKIKKKKKRCCRCKIEKSFDEFSDSAGRLDGKQNKCKPCRLICGREYKQKNKEKLEEYQRNYNKIHYCKKPRVYPKTEVACFTCGKLLKLPKYLINPHRNFCNHVCHQETKKKESRHLAELRIQSQKKKCTSCGVIKKFDNFYKNSLTLDGKQKNCIDCNNQYKKDNKNTLRSKRKQYYLRNQKNMLRKGKEWRKENKIKYSAIKAKWHNEQYKNNPVYRLKFSIRARIRNALNGKNKAKTTTKLIGCSIEQFKHHIESAWLPGMTWKNNSVRGWHIDHIIPLNTFNLELEAEQMKAFSYKNCRPLWAKDNLARPADGSDI